ncbi:hypothetical protein ACF05T_27635 [Streptomyces lateritius]|uniref:Uncharacterized protein n=1 Tax=Streptomyces lateritius TaxID=67313 RepID=A0ABW6YJV0_9ACTN
MPGCHAVRGRSAVGGTAEAGGVPDLGVHPCGEAGVAGFEVAAGAARTRRFPRVAGPQAQTAAFGGRLATPSGWAISARRAPASRAASIGAGPHPGELLA